MFCFVLFVNLAKCTFLDSSTRWPLCTPWFMRSLLHPRTQWWLHLQLLQCLSLSPAPFYPDTLPEEIRIRSPDADQTNFKQRYHKATRQGKKKGGNRARLQRETCKQLTLPALILANVRSSVARSRDTNKQPAPRKHAHNNPTGDLPHHVKSGLLITV